jgi:NAD dependent epimerase/dehydratase family enzyme
VFGRKRGGMKIVIAGGTGQVGAVLSRAFHGANEIVVLSRRPGENNLFRTALWDGKRSGRGRRNWKRRT